MSSPGPLARAFYARDPRSVAADLIGCHLVHRLPDGERLVLRLVEVEVYLGDGTDPASHAHRGQTARNRSMFGPAGTLYAYRSYGIHVCVNVVCGSVGHAAAVLLRAGEPLCGLERMCAHRGLEAGVSRRLIASGPGRFAEALGLTLAHDGHSLLRSPLSILPPAPDGPRPQVETGPRIGITKAADLPFRFFDAASDCVSRYRSGGKRTRERVRSAGR
jgi:DNA-3-methyladenine glycosylase